MYTVHFLKEFIKQFIRFKKTSLSGPRPEIKSVQRAQYKLDSHLQDTLPLHLEAGVKPASLSIAHTLIIC
jgi:hypothetical protein